MTQEEEASLRNDRSEAIIQAVEYAYQSGAFQRDIVKLDQSKLDDFLDEYILRLKEWKKRISSSNQQHITLDRHKVGALTAVTLMKNPVLYVVEGKVDVGPFEADPNLYIALRLAIARIMQDHPEKRKLVTFKSREMSSIMRGLANDSMLARDLAFTLYLYEVKLCQEFEIYISP